MEMTWYYEWKHKSAITSKIISRGNGCLYIHYIPVPPFAVPPPVIAPPPPPLVLLLFAAGSSVLDSMESWEGGGGGGGGGNKLPPECWKQKLHDIFCI